MQKLQASQQMSWNCTKKVKDAQLVKSMLVINNRFLKIEMAYRSVIFAQA